MMNFGLENEKLCIKNEELCIKNEEFCIKNDEFCRPAELPSCSCWEWAARI